MSNSLLMNLMIENLLNENPRLKKNLLKEHNDAGIHTALSSEEQSPHSINIDDTDELEVLPNQHKILSKKEVLGLNEPKGGKLVKILKNIALVGTFAITVGMAATALFHDKKSVTKDSKISDHNIEQVIKDISEQSPDDSNVLADQIIKEFESSPRFDDDTMLSIISHEGFSGIPYIDENNVSIGHGTGVYFGSKNNPSSIKSTWKKDLYKLYSVPSNLQKLDTGSSISKETAKFIFNKKYSETKKKLYNTARYLHLFPQRIQAAVIDLAYNMGPNFVNKFKLFDENMSLAGKAIEDKNIDMANIFLQSAADELVNNYNRGKTKYATDLPGRSSKVHQAISEPISADFDFKTTVINPPDKRYENKKYSLKNVFFS